MSKIRAFSTLCLLFTSSFAVADNGTWSAVNQSQRSSIAQQKSGHFYRVDSIKLRQQLSRAMHEGRSQVTSQIELPVKNGSIQKFYIEESPVMAAGLAAKYPKIKSYKIYGIDNPYASGRISISPKGFNGMITGPSGTFYIDPDSDDVYKTYSKKSQTTSQPFNCGVTGHNHQTPVANTNIASRPAQRSAGSLKVYRLAVAATYEYVSAVKNPSSILDPAIKDDVMAEIHNAINRVNQIYERDLGIRLELINRNDELLYTTPEDPYTNNNGLKMLGENQKNIDAVINPNFGDNNYDIGHVFSTGGGGIAEVGSVCSSLKAGGVTGLLNPVGEAFYIDYVAHEIGHQFSAEHTFNGTEGSCADPNRWQSTAFEPGSGSTIMSYAGICSSENISRNAVAMFHAGSIDLVDFYTTSGNGATCGTSLSIDNSVEPLANAGRDFTIPQQTPFVLTALGTDGNNDPITFSWDQMDAGTETNASTFGKDLGDNSLFRSYAPDPSNERHFPALGTTLKNQYDYSEVLACKTRDINFRLTVLDGKSGIARDNVVILVDNASGPFEITSHASSQILNPGTAVISWNVANTNKSPVNCLTVDISLLTFNPSLTNYSETLLSSGESNDGNAMITIPDSSNLNSRFKIKCSDNIFYDISDSDLIISGSTAFTTDEKTVFYNVDGENYSIFTSPAEVCPENSSGGGGSGSLGPYWLLSLLSTAIFRKKLKIRS